MKIKRVVSQRVFKRFRNMTIAATLIACVTYMSDWSVKDIMSTLESHDTDMSDYGIFVNADEDETDAGEQQLRRLAETLTAEEQKEKDIINYRHPWPHAFCLRGTKDCMGPYTRRKSLTESTDIYGIKSYKFDGEYENREVGISYVNASSYENMEIQKGSNGFVEEYWNTEHCFR